LPFSKVCYSAPSPLSSTWMNINIICGADTFMHGTLESLRKFSGNVIMLDFSCLIHYTHIYIGYSSKMLPFVITKALRDSNPTMFTEVGESLSLNKRERHSNNICERKASKTV
jgi:hypothetical protein